MSILEQLDEKAIMSLSLTRFSEGERIRIYSFDGKYLKLDKSQLEQLIQELTELKDKMI